MVEVVSYKNIKKNILYPIRISQVDEIFIYLVNHEWM